MNFVLPQRIVCLTEETTEWLYLLGEEARIVGISGYTVRPRRAREEKPKVSAFLSAKIDKILALQPDCVFGFSDLQADIAAALIRAGVQVTIFNQRSVDEIFSMLYQVAAIVGQAELGAQRLHAMRQSLQDIQATATGFKRRPKVYFEEWDAPHISCIRWVSELIHIAGGDDCFPELAKMPMGKDRILPNDQPIIDSVPDIIIGSLCGKKFRPNFRNQISRHFATRPCGAHRWGAAVASHHAAMGGAICVILPLHFDLLCCCVAYPASRMLWSCAMTVVSM
jgi:iron complex transport system substrate-binding protein